MTKRVLIVIGAATYNRGSEALLSGLVHICKATGLSYLAVSSADFKINQRIDLQYIDDFFPRYNEIYNKRSILRKINATRSYIGFSDIITKITCSHFIKKSVDFDLIIIVGADNLDSKAEYKKELNSIIDILSSKSNAKLMLFNCSIEDNNIDKYLIENLQKCSVVTARDKISYTNLNSTKNIKLHYIPDPAFTIKPEVIQCKILQDDVVGLNVSNKVAGKEGTARYKLVFESYCRLIEYITLELKMKVLLIPHVMNNADLSVLSELYNKYRDESDKVLIIEDEGLNSGQLKYIISRCRYFVGARTHATIAAYSSCVPTLVLGYSIKSIGIADDLFGTDQNYVIPVTSLDNPEDLLNGFKWLIKNESYVRKKLENIMPNYIESAWKSKDLIRNILVKND